MACLPGNRSGAITPTSGASTSAKGKFSLSRSLKKSGFRSSPRSTTAGKESLHAEIESKTSKDGGIFNCLGKMTVS